MCSRGCFTSTLAGITSLGYLSVPALSKIAVTSRTTSRDLETRFPRSSRSKHAYLPLACFDAHLASTQPSGRHSFQGDSLVALLFFCDSGCFFSGCDSCEAGFVWCFCSLLPSPKIFGNEKQSKLSERFSSRLPQHYHKFSTKCSTGRVAQTASSNNAARVVSEPPVRRLTSHTTCFSRSSVSCLIGACRLLPLVYLCDDKGLPVSLSPTAIQSCRVCSSSCPGYMLSKSWERPRKKKRAQAASAWGKFLVS